MPRRSGFSGLITQIARDSVKRQREQQKNELAKARKAEQSRKQALKLNAQASKEAKQRYLESRMQETEDSNKELESVINELSLILENTLTVDDSITFDNLRIHDEFRTFELPPDLQKEPILTSREQYFSKIQKPTTFEKLLPGWEGRYQKQLQEAEKLYKEYQVKFETIVSERSKKVSSLQEEYDKEKQTFDLKIQQRNQETDEFEKAYKSGEPQAITAYYTMVLENSNYPEDFPQEFRIAYVPEPKEIVVEYELPHKKTIPQ